MTIQHRKDGSRGVDDWANKAELARGAGFVSLLVN